MSATITPTYRGAKGSAQFGATLRERVNAYFKETGTTVKGDVRLAPKVLGMLALFVAPWVLVLTVDMPLWLALVFVIATGVGMARINVRRSAEIFVKNSGHIAGSGNTTNPSDGSIAGWTTAVLNSVISKLGSVFAGWSK